MKKLFEFIRWWISEIKKENRVERENAMVIKCDTPKTLGNKIRSY